MGKKRGSKEAESRRKQARKEQDEALAAGGGVFGAAASDRWENELQDYETRPRTTNGENFTAKVEGLPIKTADGRISRVMHERSSTRQQPGEDSDEESGPNGPTELSKIEEENEEQEEEEDEYAGLTPRERLTKTKEDVADLASLLMEDPELHVSNLTRLRKMTRLKNPVTAQLAIMALIPIFKALAPSYKIRELTDTERREKVTKEVAKIRLFEQALVQNYQDYVSLLGQLARVSYTHAVGNNKITAVDTQMGHLAAKAACELSLLSLRYFNRRTEVFLIVIRRLNRKPSHEKDLEVFLQCVRTLETLLIEDAEQGDISFDIMKTACKSIKDKKFRIDESVLNVFLSLQILADYDPHGSNEDEKPKLRKKDRVHLLKKERKARKERKEIDEEMRKAEQTMTAEERERFQAQILKMLLTLYLEILKSGGSTGEGAHLTASVLEGLAKFGLMANFDLLGDFLEVLREIIADLITEHSISAANPANGNTEDFDEDIFLGIWTGQQLRTLLLCIATAFLLVLSQSQVGRLPVSIDFSRFIDALYGILAELSLDCDLEFLHKTLRLVDPLAAASDVPHKPSVNVSTKAELLLRCLDAIFMRSRSGTLTRAASFIKRLYIMLLQTPEKTSLAGLKLVGKIVSRYDDSLKGLWSSDDRISGEGTYVLGIEASGRDRDVEIERSNGGSATLWENVLLESHFSPMVRDGARALLKNSKEGRE